MKKKTNKQTNYSLKENVFCVFDIGNIEYHFPQYLDSLEEPDGLSSDAEKALDTIYYRKYSDSKQLRYAPYFGSTFRVYCCQIHCGTPSTMLVIQ